MPRGRRAGKQVGVQEHSEGFFVARYQVRGKDVRKRFQTHSQAADHLSKVRVYQEDGVHVPSSAKVPLLPKDKREALLRNGALLEDLCDMYLARLERAGTVRDLVNPRHRIKVIKEAFRDRAAATIRPFEIEDWLEGIKHPATRNRYKSTLSSVYKFAISWEQLESNPCEKIRHYRVQVPQMNWLSEADEDKLRAVLQSWIDETPVHHRLLRLYREEHQNELTVAIGTGVRKANQYGLDWRSCDMDAQTITLLMTKSGKPYTVPMTDDVYAALLDQRRIHREIATLERRSVGDENIRRNAGNRVFTITENRQWWGMATKAAGLTLRWHDLRHTTASRMAQGGANQKAIQSVLGHASMAMSARYTHMDPEHLRGPMAVLNRRADLQHS